MRSASKIVYCSVKTAAKIEAHLNKRQATVLSIVRSTIMLVLNRTKYSSGAKISSIGKQMADNRLQSHESCETPYDNIQ